MKVVIPKATTNVAIAIILILPSQIGFCQLINTSKNVIPEQNILQIKANKMEAKTGGGTGLGSYSFFICKSLLTF